MRSIILLSLISIGISCTGASAVAAVRPWDGPPQLLSALPYDNAVPTKGQIHLDDYDNIRINSDASGQLQNEEMVCVNPLNPDQLVAVWRDFRFGYRRVGVGYSTDGGFTWHDELFPQMYYPWQSDPVLTVDAEGTFTAMMMSYHYNYDPAENGLITVQSTDGGQTWHDSLFAIDGDASSFEDKEMIAVDRSDSPYCGSLYCIWTRFFGYPYTDSTDIAIVCKHPDSTEYTAPVYVSQLNSNQWANVAVGTEGEVYVSWVSYLLQSIMFSRSADGGRTFSPERVIVQTQFVSANINGEILIFSYAAMAVDETDGPYSGRLYLVYTDALPDLSETDIWLMFSDDGGDNWSGRQLLNDDDEGYPVDQFHPWITVDPLGRVWVVFYDRRNDPNNYLFDVYFTVSTDGGQTWRDNERVTSVSSDPQAGSRAGLLGEYIGLCASENTAHMVWTDTRLGDQDVFGAVIDSVFVSVEPLTQSLLHAQPTLSAFPNPGNAAITLIYELPQTGPAGLTLYNICGRQIWNQPQHFMTAGQHQIKLDLSNLATGLYIAELNAKGDIARTKLILTK